MARMVLFYEREDENFLPYTKTFLQQHAIWPTDKVPTTLAEVEIAARKRELHGCIVAQTALLKKLVELDPEIPAHVAAKATLDDFQGSVFERGGLRYVITNPISHIATVSHGAYLFKRFVSKIHAGDFWFRTPRFTWERLRPATYQRALDEVATANLVAIDIETLRQGLVFDCISFCAVWLSGSTLRTHTYVIAVDSDFDLAWVQRFCATPAAKVFQNGKYDNNYLLRFGVVVDNWLWDTAHMFHSWYSELPKNLGLIAAHSLRDVKFWKDEGHTADVEDRHRYCAKDSFNTAMSLLSILNELPDWAKQNYLMEFPLVYPCVMAELRGLKIDPEAFEQLKVKMQAANEAKTAKLQAMLGIPNFNPASPKQVQQLIHALGSKDISSTDKVAMDKFKNRHPLNELFADLIKEIREDRKVIGSYLKDKIFFTDGLLYKEGYPILLYSLNPQGTDTARLASKEHHFWCGLQIQNIKRDDDGAEEGNVKDYIIPYEGFELGECDYEQAEARDTGYLSGDTNLIAAVDSGKDFHATNASSFFGVPYEKIYSDEKQKTLDKALRDLAKRTNHGANYNMRALMLLMTMGIKNVIRARKLLGLPSFWSLLKVCEHLLAQFDKTYPVVRGSYQEWIKAEVAKTNMLVSPMGWTRYCFGNPTTKRPDLNSYVAHRSQNLNATTLNKAYLKVFYEIALPNPHDFKLCPQIHDSILFQYRKGRLDLAYAVRDAMIMTTPVTDIFGITRNLTVPAALKACGTRWSKLKEMPDEMPTA